MAVRAASGGRALSLDTLVRLGRGLHAPATPRRLAMPEGMTAPLGCDAVRIPARLGPLVPFGASVNRTATPRLSNFPALCHSPLSYGSS